MNFIPVAERPVPHLHGEQKIYRFPNGYGASVVRHSYSYGSERGLWELAVVTFNGTDHYNITLEYSTPVTSDVEGCLSDDDVQRLLKEISELPVLEEAK